MKARKSAGRPEWIRLIRQDLRRLAPALFLLLPYGGITQYLFHTVCPFAILTGFPCPACGMTRAVLLFFTGDPMRSLALHPLAMIWLLLALWLAFSRYFRSGPTPFAGHTPFALHTPLALPSVILLCLATFLCYFCRIAAGTLPQVPCPGILALVQNNRL